MSGADRAHHLPIGDAYDSLAASGEESAVLYEHGSLLVKAYAPRGIDRQKPHARDEIYVIMRGEGAFFDGEARRAAGPGDFLFAPAGAVHRFEDFTPDFAVWVMYFGPEGGEAASARDRADHLENGGPA